MSYGRITIVPGKQSENEGKGGRKGTNMFSKQIKTKTRKIFIKNREKMGETDYIAKCYQNQPRKICQLALNVQNSIEIVFQYKNEYHVGANKYIYDLSFNCVMSI